MKKQKISLDTLKVQSFITKFDNRDQEHIQGGATVGSGCESNCGTCMVHMCGFSGEPGC